MFFNFSNSSRSSFHENLIIFSFFKHIFLFLCFQIYYLRDLLLDSLWSWLLQFSFNFILSRSTEHLLFIFCHDSITSDLLSAFLLISLYVKLKLHSFSIPHKSLLIFYLLFYPQCSTIISLFIFLKFLYIIPLNPLHNKFVYLYPFILSTLICYGWPESK